MAIEINISLDDYFELKNLKSGVYKPLEDLVNKDNFLSIINDYKTVSGDIFPSQDICVNPTLRE